MQRTTGPKQNTGDQSGVVMIWVALAMIALIGFAALAIDVGYLMAGRNEAQNAADASALAACRELGEQHYQNQNPVDENKVRHVAIEVAGANSIGGKKFSELDMHIEEIVDVKTGFWNPEEKKFSEEPIGFLQKKNSVMVTLRDNNPDKGFISTFFGKALGIESLSVHATATAALTGASKAPEGELIPAGISKYWFYHDWPNNFCDQPIKFYPTNNIVGCAGWNTFQITPSSANNLRGIFEGILDGTYTSPELGIGDSLEFTAGNIANAFCHSSANHHDLQDLWMAYKDEDGDWKTSVVVYDMDSCNAPNTSLPIVGFSTAIIHNVDCDNHIIDATVICDEYIDSRGGGGLYGTYGRIPGLVQ